MIPDPLQVIRGLQKHNDLIKKTKACTGTQESKYSKQVQFCNNSADSIFQKSTETVLSPECALQF